MNRQKYLDELREMLTGAPGHTTTTLRNYLAPLETRYADGFDPIRAIDDLISVAQLLKQRLQGGTQQT